VKAGVVVDDDSEKENIGVTAEEIDVEIGKIAEKTKRPLEKVREVLTRDDGLDRLKTQIRNKKTLDFLQERARVQNVG